MQTQIWTQNDESVQNYNGLRNKSQGNSEKTKKEKDFTVDFNTKKGPK